MPGTKAMGTSTAPWLPTALYEPFPAAWKPQSKVAIRPPENSSTPARATSTPNAGRKSRIAVAATGSSPKTRRAAFTQ